MGAHARVGRGAYSPRKLIDGRKWAGTAWIGAAWQGAPALHCGYCGAFGSFLCLRCG